MAVVELLLPALPAHVRTARLVCVAVARRAGLSDALVDELRLAVGEACARAVGLHARHAPDVRVAVTITDDFRGLTVAVRDRGPAAGPAVDDMTGGLLDAGPQTAAWLWVCWHAGFLAGVLAFALVGRLGADVVLSPRRARLLAAGVGILAPCLAAAITLLATVGHRLLPALVRGSVFTPLFSLASPLGAVLVGLGILALAALLAGHRRLTVVETWLAVAALACLLDIGGARLSRPGSPSPPWPASWISRSTSGCQAGSRWAGTSRERTRSPLPLWCCSPCSTR